MLLPMHSDISVDYDAHHKPRICVEYTLQLDALDSIVSTSGGGKAGSADGK